MLTEAEVRKMLVEMQLELIGLEAYVDVMDCGVPDPTIELMNHDISNLRQAEYLLKVVLGDLPLPL